VLVCVAEAFEGERWFDDVVLLHGRMLASPGFYVGIGNHALNQSIGLLDIACHVGRRDWQVLARERLAALVARSVDAEGVTNEQAVKYQMYNWDNYDRARRHLTRCGLETPPEFARIDRMGELLAHATLPDGSYVMIGDTGRRQARIMPGTIAEFAATAGASGPRPTSRLATFRAGFAFGRSGWGTNRPFEDETAWSIRYQRGPLRFHGHADATSVTLYGGRRPLIEDPGQFTYNADSWREYAVSRRAHNVVAVEGVTYDTSRGATLVRARSAPTVDEVVVRDLGYPGVAVTRRVAFSASLHYLVVEDRLSADRPRVFRQLWHLAEGSAPAVNGTTVRTTNAGPGLAIVQVLDTGRPTIVEGRENPTQGWLSYDIDQRIPAPVVEVPISGQSARFVTLLAPIADTGQAIAVDRVATTSDGFSFRIRLGSRAEVVTATGTGVTIRSEPGALPIRASRSHTLAV